MLSQRERRKPVEQGGCLLIWQLKECSKTFCLWYKPSSSTKNWKTTVQPLAYSSKQQISSFCLLSIFYTRSYLPFPIWAKLFSKETYHFQPSIDYTLHQLSEIAAKKPLIWEKYKWTWVITLTANNRVLLRKSYSEICRLSEICSAVRKKSDLSFKHMGLQKSKY